ncbi:unnamed protein product [Nippostrongylus brasiliensis]|uniref:Vacuolar protein sorting-associated protein 52 homolog n=1 Tax=Nippostrongylus brasiliensis TaxID=27835 RepID=A0A158QZ35_NIPBR|nr:unnamed protein product [Nippostrongylus brasiliensis]
MQQMLRAKIAALGPEAKGFVMKVKQSVGILRIISEGGMPSGAALASHVNQVRAAYRSLSPAAQAELKQQFPFVTARPVFIDKLLTMIRGKGICSLDDHSRPINVDFCPLAKLHFFIT